MKAVILAGGLGTRLSEETTVKPKPMVEIGEMPILWHIMKSFSHYGVNDFIICLGYKGHMIKEFFSSYMLRSSNITFDMTTNNMEIHDSVTEPWKVTLIDTGLETLTGGRLKRVKGYIGDETFCFTYGDGISDINISELIDFHKQNKKLASLTAVQPPGRYGAFTLHSDQAEITSFREKPKGDGAWINGGYFVLEPEAIDFIEGDSTTWEQEPLKKLAHRGQLMAYKHTGFWQAMDTLRDKHVLEEIWGSGEVPWKVW